MTPVGRRFRNLFYHLAPRWLVEGEGEQVWYSLTATMDIWTERLRQGLYARFPEFAPDDALSALGRDRRIVRGRNESAESYARRLLRFLDDHRVRGNPFALMDQLRAYIGKNVRIRTVDARGNWFTRNADGTRSFALAKGNWDWDGSPATSWSRFWVIVYSVAGDLEAPWGRIYWGDPLEWGASGLTWGSTATYDEVRAIRSIVRDWKPQGTRCKNIIIVLDDAAAFDPTDPPGAPLPDGTWGRYGLDNITAARDSRAIYWRGTS